MTRPYLIKNDQIEVKDMCSALNIDGVQGLVALLKYLTTKANNYFKTIPKKVINFFYLFFELQLDLQHLKQLTTYMLHYQYNYN